MLLSRLLWNEVVNDTSVIGIGKWNFSCFWIYIWTDAMHHMFGLIIVVGWKCMMLFSIFWRKLWLIFLRECDNILCSFDIVIYGYNKKKHEYFRQNSPNISIPNCLHSACFFFFFFFVFICFCIINQQGSTDYLCWWFVDFFHFIFCAHIQLPSISWFNLYQYI